MPILAYCVSLAHHFLDAPTSAVGQGMVYEVEDLGLRAWYSEVEEDTFSGAEHVTKAALEFHHFVSAVFREGTVLPFRFPTILESIDDLRTHLEDKTSWYTDALRQSEGLVQFEVRIVSKIKLPPDPESGREYLEARKALKERTTAAVSRLVQGLDDYLRDHHVKDTQQGTRVYLLVERGRIAEFRNAAGQIAIPAGFEVRLTGPWPPTEFVPTQEGEG
ncbi:Gas vesicle synthesis GvpLGvpF [Candidatus Koribacter versatilis Ellin345]|uniref:Gas vesicle synthesis GvpLGvpF n=1 Tax=Koribacter versatilis (strain Ellin345) TaxID=204669 RepID=Q1INZ2_KORVE|nr:GvpL/GvpF family gas vesicle protein [Candidatus Koribacter versatilis]ABF41408.1 Gas vesicle synthesis GvpLGvpF [Candidatus Koribacter versatilis Ellin345]